MGKGHEAQELAANKATERNMLILRRKFLLRCSLRADGEFALSRLSVCLDFLCHELASILSFESSYFFPRGTQSMLRGNFSK